MKLAIFALCVAAACAATVPVFKADYETAAIDMDLINLVNQGNHAWKAGMNEYWQDKTVADAKLRLGLQMPSEEELEAWPKYEPSADFKASASFDSREKWANCVFPVRDQGHCGSCWAFGAAEAMTDRWCIASGKQVVMSPQDLVSCDHAMSMGCNGGTLTPTWAYMGLSGILEDHCFPYHSGKGEVPSCVSQCEDGSDMVKHKVHPTSIRMHLSIDGILEDVESAGPNECAFTVYRDFLAYKEGVYHHVSGEELGGHAIKLIGWGNEDGKDFWLIQNSWSEKWGDNGFFKILKGSNECGIEGSCVAGKPAV